MELIRCEKLTLAYNGKTVLDRLSFQVRSGDYLCILGENGSGKSTLLRTLLGLKAPESGTVRFAPDLRKNQIGYLPQQTAAQKDFPASVWEVVLSGCLGRCGRRPYYSNKEKQAARDAMKKMDLETMENRCYRELSGGQQQRVLLARAFCAAQRLLLLDEPASALDPQMSAEMYRQIEALHRSGVTVIMISHDVDAAAHYAGKILLLGRERYYGPKACFVESSIGKRFLGRGRWNT